MLDQREQIRLRNLFSHGFQCQGRIGAFKITLIAEPPGHDVEHTETALVALWMFGR